MSAALQCPPNSTYASCMSACPASCSDLAAPAECSTPCLEGCECLPGHVLSGFDCVPYRECGYTFLGKYYKVEGNDPHPQYPTIQELHGFWFSSHNAFQVTCSNGLYPKVSLEGKGPKRCLASETGGSSVWVCISSLPLPAHHQA